MDEKPKNPKSNDLANRRAFIRLSKSLTVHYKLIKNSKVPGEVPNPSDVRASTKDISAGGLAFYLKQNIPLYSILEIHLVLPDGPEPVVCLAEVVRSRLVENTPYCDTAVCFLDLSGRDRQRLDAFVRAEAR